MKKLALLADLHSNLEAVTACLAHAERSGADAWAFLGDLVGYGADPEAVLDLVMDHARRGAIVVRGNHDDAALDERGAEGMNSAADEAAAWTRRHLSATHREFLSGLPFQVRQDDMLFVHGSAASPEKFVYVTEPRSAAFSLSAAGDAAYVFCGHVHEPVLYYTSVGARPLPFRPVPGVAIPTPARKRWLAVVGSAGQPRDGNTAACYALLDRERSTLTFQRVPYDWARAAEKIRAAGLPERLAVRLSRGE
jgi:diadenosine tetraphosphatase ApaH/serine/threonine PP2A family protein phosphatase